MRQAHAFALSLVKVHLDPYLILGGGWGLGDLEKSVEYNPIRE